MTIKKSINPQIPPVMPNRGYTHLKPERSPNSRKSICGLDYQYLNKYTKVRSRVTCETCLWLMGEIQL